MELTTSLNTLRKKFGVEGTLDATSKHITTLFVDAQDVFENAKNSYFKRFEQGGLLKTLYALEPASIACCIAQLLKVSMTSDTKIGPFLDRCEEACEDSRRKRADKSVISWICANLSQISGEFESYLCFVRSEWKEYADQWDTIHENSFVEQLCEDVTWGNIWTNTYWRSAHHSHKNLARFSKLGKDVFSMPLSFSMRSDLSQADGSALRLMDMTLGWTLDEFFTAVLKIQFLNELQAEHGLERAARRLDVLEMDKEFRREAADLSKCVAADFEILDSRWFDRREQAKDRNIIGDLTEEQKTFGRAFAVPTVLSPSAAMGYFCEWFVRAKEALFDERTGVAGIWYRMTHPKKGESVFRVPLLSPTDQSMIKECDSLLSKGFFALKQEFKEIDAHLARYPAAIDAANASWTGLLEGCVTKDKEAGIRKDATTALFILAGQLVTTNGQGEYWEFGHLRRFLSIILSMKGAVTKVSTDLKIEISDKESQTLKALEKTEDAITKASFDAERKTLKELVGSLRTRLDAELKDSAFDPASVAKMEKLCARRVSETTTVGALTVLSTCDLLAVAQSARMDTS